MQHIRAHVLICGGTGCKSAGSKEVQLAFSRAIEAKGLSDEVMVVETGCHGFCEPVSYTHLTLPTILLV